MENTNIRSKEFITFCIEEGLKKLEDKESLLLIILPDSIVNYVDSLSSQYFFDKETFYSFSADQLQWFREFMGKLSMNKPFLLSRDQYNIITSKIDKAVFEDNIIDVEPQNLEFSNTDSVDNAQEKKIEYNKNRSIEGQSNNSERVDSPNSSDTVKNEIFLPKEGRYYSLKNLMCLEVSDKQFATKSVEWFIYEYPKVLYKTILEYNIEIEGYDKLVVELEEKHLQFLLHAQGLDREIQFYGVLGSAREYYNNQPSLFYTWYNKNKEQVFLSDREYAELVEKVKILDPNILSAIDCVRY